MRNDVPVVVMKDEGGHGALAVARTLGRLGVKTYLVTEKGPTAVLKSRYWSKTFTWDFRTQREWSVRFMLELSREISTKAGAMPILLAIADSSALFIDENVDELSKAFILPRPAPGTLKTLTNKWEMAAAARAHGIPAPYAAYPASRDEVVKYVEAARFPIVMKGVDQLLPQAKWKKIVHNVRDLLERYDEACANGPANLMLQEYIPGGDEAVWMCNAYFGKGSECRAIFSGRKLRQTPPHAGIATLAVCERNELVEEQTRRFMQAMRFEGTCGIGWRYDERDCRYKVLDVNPRISGVFRLFTPTNDMDVVRIAYLDLTRQPIPATALAPGRKWMLEEDLFTAITYAQQGELTVRQWIASLRGIEETHWFAFDDVVPFVAWLNLRLWSNIRGAVERRCKWLARRFAAMFRQRTLVPRRSSS